MNTLALANRTQRHLLACGIIASLLYVAMNVGVPPLDPEYDWVSQTVSELSAIDAPTRSVWVPLGAAYSALVILFGYGVWRLRQGSRALGLAGALLIVNGLFSLYWPPMHMRGADATLTDTLHIVWAAVTVFLMFAVMLIAAFAMPRQFRIYSVVTIVVLLATGIITGLEGRRLAENLPTPYIGVWERISIAAYMAWVIVFAIMLRRRLVAPGLEDVADH
jgi:hypothetical membrane protein